MEKKDPPYGEMRYERERPEIIEKQHEDDRQNVQKSPKIIQIQRKIPGKAQRQKIIGRYVRDHKWQRDWRQQGNERRYPSRRWYQELT